MSVRLLYFAGLREALGTAAEEITLPPGLDSLGALRQHLAQRGGSWLALARTKNLRFALNQNMASADAPLADGDEVAFFPPVTGG